MSERAFIERQYVIRRDLLAALYAQRRAGRQGFVGELTDTLGYDPEDCAFALDYLVEAGYVKRPSGHCRITASGIEHFERELQTWQPTTYTA